MHSLLWRRWLSDRKGIRSVKSPVPPICQGFQVRNSAQSALTSAAKQKLRTRTTEKVAVRTTQIITLPFVALRNWKTEKCKSAPIALLTLKTNWNRHVESWKRHNSQRGQQVRFQPTTDQSKFYDIGAIEKITCSVYSLPKIINTGSTFFQVTEDYPVKISFTHNVDPFVVGYRGNLALNNG